MKKKLFMIGWDEKELGDDFMDEKELDSLIKGDTTDSRIQVQEITVNDTTLLRDLLFKIDPIKCESGWLIELFDKNDNSLNLALTISKQYNILKYTLFDEALRFSRKEDAELFWKYIMHIKPDIKHHVRFTEHVW